VATVIASVWVGKPPPKFTNPAPVSFCHWRVIPPTPEVVPANVKVKLVPGHVVAGPETVPATGEPAQSGSGMQLTVALKPGKVTEASVQNLSVSGPSVEVNPAAPPGITVPHHPPATVLHAPEPPALALLNNGEEVLGPLYM